MERSQDDEVPWVDIQGLDKAAVLAALFHASQPRGMGLYHRLCREDLTLPDAQDLIEEQNNTDFGRDFPFRFDHVHGRPLKVDLSGDAFSPSMFDQDNGEGAAARAVQTLREGHVH